MRARCLVITASPDYPEQYVPVMNCIFAAQKLKVTIDSIYLGGKEKGSSSFLQQASHITSGIHIKPNHKENLAQYLLVNFFFGPPRFQIFSYEKNTVHLLDG